MSNYKLVLPSIDRPTGLATIEDLIKDLQRKISYQYSVYPVDSCYFHEKFEDEDGNEFDLIHKTFGYMAKGRINNLGVINEMFNRLWEDLKNAWPPGSLVMWRLRPKVEESNDKDLGWFEDGKKAPDENAPDNWRISLRIRIGSISPCNIKSVEDSHHLPLLEN